MNVHKEARRRAVRLRQRFHDTREVFSQDDYRLALREELRGLGISDEFSDAIAEQIDNETCGVKTAEDVACMKHMGELLRPYWGPGVTMEQAVAAYRAAHSSIVHEHEWVVFSTALEQHALMMECVLCRAFGVVEGAPPAGPSPGGLRRGPGAAVGRAADQPGEARAAEVTAPETYTLVLRPLPDPRSVPIRLLLRQHRLRCVSVAPGGALVGEPDAERQPERVSKH